jgi:hypothetical protein
VWRVLLYQTSSASYDRSERDLQFGCSVRLRRSARDEELGFCVTHDINSNTACCNYTARVRHVGVN